jgi:hypothetical protein
VVPSPIVWSCSRETFSLSIIINEYYVLEWGHMFTWVCATSTNNLATGCLIGRARRMLAPVDSKEKSITYLDWTSHFNQIFEITRKTNTIICLKTTR